VIAIGAALWAWREPIGALLGDRERLQAWVGRLGPWGPLATIGLNIAQVLLAPIPGQFVGVMNGYLYGIAAGTLYSMIGLVIGTGTAMVLGRRFGRPLVERLVDPAQLTRWDEITAHQGPWFFFLVFLFPFLPDDLTSFLIGLSPLSIPRMLILTTLGRLPGVFVSCWVGARATALPWWAWIPLGGGAATLAWLFWRYHTELEDLVVRVVQRLARPPGIVWPD
jgi:uncharacterized membrane protein YdjX (TVP38/TMEM64 family)